MTCCTCGLSRRASASVRSSRANARTFRRTTRSDRGRSRAPAPPSPAMPGRGCRRRRGRCCARPTPRAPAPSARARRSTRTRSSRRSPLAPRRPARCCGCPASRCRPRAPMPRTAWTGSRDPPRRRCAPPTVRGWTRGPARRGRRLRGCRCGRCRVPGSCVDSTEAERCSEHSITGGATVGQGRIRVECKVNPDRLDTTAIETFRELYPEGDNFIVCPAVKTPCRIRWSGRVMMVCTTRDLS